MTNDITEKKHQAKDLRSVAHRLIKEVESKISFENLTEAQRARVTKEINDFAGNLFTLAIDIERGRV